MNPPVHECVQALGEVMILKAVIEQCSPGNERLQHVLSALFSKVSKPYMEKAMSDYTGTVLARYNWKELAEAMELDVKWLQEFVTNLMEHQHVVYVKQEE